MVEAIAVVGGYLIVAIACATPLAVRTCRTAQLTTNVVWAHLLGGLMFMGVFFIALVAGYLLLLTGGNPG
jgi:hypothetical protein